MTQNTNICIMQTTDYNSIKHINGNRIINQANVSNIMLSMAKKQLIVPAIVNENMELIDGQHRHEACMKSGLPFYYIIVKGYGLKEVQKINAFMSNWKAKDYMDSFLARYSSGEKEFAQYGILKDFMDRFNLNLNVATVIADIAKGKNEMSEDFMHGKFEFKDLNESISFAESMEVFQQYSPRLYGKVGLPREFSKLYYNSNYSQGTMEKNLLTQHRMLNDATTQDVTLEILVDIYNYRLNRNSKLHSSLLNDAWKDMIEEKALEDATY